MPEKLGLHNPRIAQTRDLLTKKGRKASGRFLIEGPTLLEEALAHGAPLESVFVSQSAYEATPLVQSIEAGGTEVLIVPDGAAAKLSDLATPSGITGVCVAQTVSPEQFFARDGLILILAGINDPGNAGTLVRSADAFGVTRVLFGAGGAEPFHPKVVRATMGSLFRVEIAVATPAEAAEAAAGTWTVAGLAATGGPLAGLQEGGPRRALVVGHERHGLGDWAAVCTRTVAIPMRGRAESLNAAVAGSIALFEATRGSN